MRRIEIALLLTILVLALLVRLYKIDNPIADWHSWRQADTAAVTRNFIKEGFNPLYPKFDDMSGISENPVPNLGRFRFVEFPIYNIAVYPIYVLFGINDMYHRLVSVLFSLGSVVFVYLIAKRYVDTFTAFISTTLFSFLPFNIFFSRTNLPEPTFIFFALGMIYFVDKWIWYGQKIHLWIGYFFTSIAFLIKPWAVFFALPLIYSVLVKEKKIKIPLRYILFALLAILPFILWRLWILQYPEGIPASSWLLNGDGIRFRPAFWWWIVSERIGGEILGVTGTFFLILGIILKSKNYFLHIWLISMLAYIVIFATGNVRHNYYQSIIVPIVSIFAGIGIANLLKGQPVFIPRIWTILISLLLIPLTIYFTWKHVSGFYQINNYPIVEAGKKADQIIPKNAIVVAPYNGDTAFLYQTNRAGFPVTSLPLSEMVAKFGVTHYISTTKDAKTKWVMRYFEILEDQQNYVIADLTKLKRELDVKDPEP